MMSVRFASRAILVLAAPAILGCELGPTGPGDVPIPVKLDFCASDTPIWFAYQTLTGPWTVVTPDAAGTFSFSIPSRAAVAFVRKRGNDFRTDVVFMTNTNFDNVADDVCVEDRGTKQLSGTVSGVTGSQLALVGMSSTSTTLTAQQTSFSLTELADRALDLVATRHDVTGSDQHANTVIIRRNQSPTSGTTIAPLNFDTEGLAASLHFATVGGLLGEETVTLQNDFISNLGTVQRLSIASTDAIANSVSFMAIPESEVVSGDFHHILALAALPLSVRGIERYFRAPEDQSLAVGPELAIPQIEQIGTSTVPNLRLQTLLPGQIEYTTSVQVQFGQQLPQGMVDVVLTVTASFFGGTPFTWSIGIPDFSSVEGWESGWGLQSGSLSWVITAYFGRPDLLLGARPADQESVQFARRVGTISFAQASGAARTRRP